MELYLVGWQTRWFVLEDGVLAYYKSQEEVKQGCKGSIKVLACEINGTSINCINVSAITFFLLNKLNDFLAFVTIWFYCVNVTYIFIINLIKLKYIIYIL